MSNRKKGVPFNPPAGALDLEYNQTRRNSNTYTAVPPSGLFVQCGGCGGNVQLPFDASIQAWDLLIALVCSALDVSRRQLLSAGGRRPSEQLHQARSCLVQALGKAAGPDVAQQWLKLQGWPLRRIKALQEVKLEGQAATVLDALPYAIQVGAHTSIQLEA